jgi:hypothetical protein
MNGDYQYKINTGMPQAVLVAEEAFSRIFHQVEVFGVPIYHDMAMAVIEFEDGNKAACARHVSNIAIQLRDVLKKYFDHLHDKQIAHSVWLSRIQGFYAWGVGSRDDRTGDWDKFDGLSGNQVLLFQALDAFIGLERYLSTRDQERNVPIRQRVFCQSIAKHSFRWQLDDSTTDEHEVQMMISFREIVKKLKVSPIDSKNIVNIDLLGIPIYTPR